MKQFVTNVFIFALLTLALFFAATVAFHESPQQTWQRIVVSYDNLTSIQPPPSLAPAPAPARPKPKPAPPVAIVLPQTNSLPTPAKPFGAPIPPGPEPNGPDLSAVLGAVYTPQATTFRLFAPTAKAVYVVLYDKAEGDEGRLETPFSRQQEGIWEQTINGNLAGKFYTYRLEGPDLDAKHEVVDPYATNSVASSTRARITPLPPPLPPGPPIEDPTDMVIYEMGVRDFTISPTSGVANPGLYLGFVEPNTTLPGDVTIKTGIDHLAELGITDVQLMPVVDFDNNERLREYNWGYCPVNYFSPEGMFATNIDDDSRVRELRALVAALHARGIGVILDVVYNHTGGTPFQAIAPKYYYRYSPDGSLSNGSACGNEFRTEAPMARKLIIDSLKYWATEYGIDGFRFDFMALIDMDTMRQAREELRKINPHIVLYGEPWDAKGSPLVDPTDTNALRVLPVGAFNAEWREALKGSSNDADPGFIQNGSRVEDVKRAMMISEIFDSPSQSINYLTCHDNLVLWDKLKISMPQADNPELIETMKLGYLALLTSQGVPFMHGGEEFARTKDGNNNSYNASDAINQVDWSLKQRNFNLFTYVRDAIALRKAHPMFRLRTREDVQNRLKFVNTSDNKVLVYTINGEGVPGETWKNICVILNSDDRAVDVPLPPGDWMITLDKNGASSGQSASGTVNVALRSGLVLFQL
jgi:pullulanase